LMSEGEMFADLGGLGTRTSPGSSTWSGLPPLSFKAVTP
jgi:hypothetical protein